MKKKPTPTEPFPQPLQGHLFACLLNDREAFEKCRPIITDEYWDDPLAPAVRFAIQYYDNTGKLAPVDLVKAKTSIELVKNDPTPVESDWLIGQIEAFCRYRAMENAVLDGIDLLRNGKGTEIADRMNEALAISINQVLTDKLETMTDLMADFPPDHLIPDLLIERQVSMIYGASRNFKSFITLHLASILAHAMKWIDYDGDQAPLNRRYVVYVAAEGGAMFSERRIAWFIANGIKLSDDDMYVYRKAVDLTDPAAIQSFIKKVRKLNKDIGWVIFDTASACIAGHSDSDDDVASLVVEHVKLISTELSCHVSFVHHEGKDATRGQRGSSAWFANVDTVLHVERHDFSATMTVEKQKDGRDGIQFHFAGKLIDTGKRDRKGRHITSVVMRQVDPAEQRQVQEQQVQDRAKADQLSIAHALNGENEMSVNQLADLMTQRQIWRNAEGSPLGKTKVRERIIAALPADTKVKVRMSDDQEAHLYRAKAFQGTPNLVTNLFSPKESERVKGHNSGT